MEHTGLFIPKGYRAVLRVFGEGLNPSALFLGGANEDPELIARAAEGFCPYRTHRHGGGDPDPTPVPVERLKDGRVRCTIGNHIMTWEWTSEPDPAYKAD